MGGTHAAEEERCIYNGGFSLVNCHRVGRTNPGGEAAVPGSEARDNVPQDDEVCRGQRGWLRSYVSMYSSK